MSRLNCDSCTRVMQFVVQQIYEKIDRTRAIAGQAFTELLALDAPIPHRAELAQLVLEFVCTCCVLR